MTMQTTTERKLQNIQAIQRIYGSSSIYSELKAYFHL